MPSNSSSQFRKTYTLFIGILVCTFPLISSLCYLSMKSFWLFILLYRKRTFTSLHVAKSAFWVKWQLQLAVRQMKHAIIPYKTDHFCPWNDCKWKLSFNWLWNISDGAHFWSISKSLFQKYFWRRAYLMNFKCKSLFAEQGKMKL